MNLKEAKSKYAFSDGQIVSCLISFTEQSSAIIILNVREQIGRKFVNVIVELFFENLIELNVYENFESE